MVVILFSVPFSIDLDVLDFFPNYSYTASALPSRETSDMPRTESSSAIFQDYFVFVLPSLGYNLPRLGPWAPMDKWARATNYWAPQFRFRSYFSFAAESFIEVIGFSHSQKSI